MRFFSATDTDFLFRWFPRSFVCLLSTASVALILIVSGIVWGQSAQARPENIIFEVLIAHPMSHRDSVNQAELSAQSEISQRFKQDPDALSLQISVLVNRHGEVIPVFTTTVSREQWSQFPQIRRWSKYHDAYALLQRYDVPLDRPMTEAIAAVPRSAATARLSISNPAVDFAFDRGALSSKQIQNSLDYWD